MTVTEVLKTSLLTLPRLDIELICCGVLNLDRSQLITKGSDPIPEEKLKLIQMQILKRTEGFPIAYLLGQKDFYKNTFEIAPGVLVPRPETELLVEAAVDFLKDKTGELQVLDMGCGSGCIGLSIAAELSNVSVTAIDISKTAVALTKKNAIKLGLQDRTKIGQLSVESLSTDQKYICVVANPPYIALGDLDVDPGVRQFEPHEALFALENGYEKIGTWTMKAWDLLENGGLWATEIGHAQASLTYKILETVGFKNIKIIKDLAGKDRMVSGVKSDG